MNPIQNQYNMQQIGQAQNGTTGPMTAPIQSSYTTYPSNNASAYSMPVNSMYATQQQQPNVKPSVGAVNIQIYNPTAGGQTGAVQPMPYAYYMPAGMFNQNNLANQQNINNAATPINNNQVVQSQDTEQQPIANNETPEKPIEAKKIKNDSSADKKNEETTKKEPLPPVSDELIMTYENYLNNENSRERASGITEVLKRFKEDESRKDDPALTALMNKALKDPSPSVRLVAMTILDSGYANGNDETIQILKQIQSSDSMYNEDAHTASEILLKLANKHSQATTK